MNNEMTNPNIENLTTSYLNEAKKFVDSPDYKIQRLCLDTNLSNVLGARLLKSQMKEENYVKNEIDELFKLVLSKEYIDFALLHTQEKDLDLNYQIKPLGGKLLTMIVHSPVPLLGLRVPKRSYLIKSRNDNMEAFTIDSKIHVRDRPKTRTIDEQLGRDYIKFNYGDYDYVIFESLQNESSQ